MSEDGIPVSSDRSETESHRPRRIYGHDLKAVSIRLERHQIDWLRNRDGYSATLRKLIDLEMAKQGENLKAEREELRTEDRGNEVAAEGTSDGASEDLSEEAIRELDEEETSGNTLLEQCNAFLRDHLRDNPSD